MSRSRKAFRPSVVSLEGRAVPAILVATVYPVPAVEPLPVPMPAPLVEPDPVLTPIQVGIRTGIAAVEGATIFPIRYVPDPDILF